LAHAVAVAVSGGRDSTALLHATAHAAVALGVEVHALHVHHGLVADADDWLRRLRAQCARWARAGLPLHFHAVRLPGRPERGDSVEAWARRERYRVLAEMARAAGCDLVLLAHHRRDQAETLLLQALRGGGPAGLAAMPHRAERDGIVWARPWLNRPRAAIEAYVGRHRLRFVDDASNEDPRFARNRLRRNVWPALSQAFPDAEMQLQAAAQRAAEAAACLAEQATADLADASDGAQLRLERWYGLSPARRAQLLRTWLREHLGGAAPESLVQRLCTELPRVRTGRWPAAAGEVQLYRGRLVVDLPAALPASPLRLDLRRPGVHGVPSWGGALRLSMVAVGGLAPARLASVELRARSGGETFQFAPRSLPRSLKKQYQARGVPEWQRAAPLLFDGTQLLFVPGLGIDARCLAAPGEAQVALEWEPADLAR